MIVILPVPPPALRPNGQHGHWAVVRKARKSARALANFRALEVLAGRPAPRAAAYSLSYHFAHRRWDDDNAIASAKSYLDGICSALGMDDRHLRFRELRAATDRACPRLEIIVWIGTPA